MRWKQPDRVFFGFGACHILAGVFLENPPLDGFYGEWIVPDNGISGNHMYVTDGQISFDFHGYTLRHRLLAHYWKGYKSRYKDWNAKIVKIDFRLLDTVELNARNHLGPDQYFGDPLPRAQRFIQSIKLPSELRENGAAKDRAFPKEQSTPQTPDHAL